MWEAAAVCCRSTPSFLHSFLPPWCRANLFGDVLPYVMASILHVKGYRVSYAHSGSPYNKRILVWEATSSLRLYRDPGENATSIVSKKST